MLLVTRISRLTLFLELYNWFEYSSTYRCLPEPSHEQWGIWLSTKMSRSTAGAPHTAQPGPAPTATFPAPTKLNRGPVPPLAVRESAAAAGLCLKFQRAYCPEKAESHTATFNVNGRPTTASLKHACAHCGSKDHGYNACPTK